MKALLCMLLLAPTLSFALDKCQKQVSENEILSFQINKILLAPINADGKANLAVYKDIIAKNKFGEPRAPIEQYQLLKVKKQIQPYIGMNMEYIISQDTKTFFVDHKTENLDKYKARLTAIIDNAVVYETNADKTVLSIKDKNGDISVIDFNAPMAANPVSTSNLRGYIKSEMYIGYMKDGLRPNPVITEALANKQYVVEECDDKISTSNIAKDLKTESKPVVAENAPSAISK